MSDPNSSASGSGKAYFSMTSASLRLSLISSSLLTASASAAWASTSACSAAISAGSRACSTRASVLRRDQREKRDSLISATGSFSVCQEPETRH